MQILFAQQSQTKEEEGKGDKCVNGLTLWRGKVGAKTFPSKLNCERMTSIQAQNVVRSQRVGSRFDRKAKKKPCHPIHNELKAFYRPWKGREMSKYERKAESESCLFGKSGIVCVDSTLWAINEHSKKSKSDEKKIRKSFRLGKNGFRISCRRGR